MFRLERQEKILAYIREHKTVTTNTLSEAFGLTPVTIRTDINALAEKGLIIKTHGGAMCIEERLNIEVPNLQKMQLHVSEKQAIGERAAALVTPGEMVILDSGTTTLEIARHLPETPVVTNDLLIGKTLVDRGHKQVFITGGCVLDTVYSLHGSETENYLSHVYVNKLFLGCDAIDLSWGVSNRTFEEVATKRAMMRSSQEVIAVADSAKMNRRVFAHLCDIEELDVLVTDSISDSDRKTLEEKGVKVICCSDETET